MIPTYGVFVSALLTILAVVSTGAAASPSATVIGTVTLTAANGDTVAAEGARVVMACERNKTLRTEVADEHGSFRFVNVPVVRCSIDADVQGFVAPPISFVAAADQVVATDLHLGMEIKLWSEVAARIDPRLQRCSLKDEEEESHFDVRVADQTAHPSAFRAGGRVLP
jgi:hypothetical protein